MENLTLKFKKNEIYTKTYKDGSKMIFQVNSVPKSCYGPNMIRVSKFCSDEEGEDIECGIDTEVYMGSKGTSEGSIITEANEIEKDILNKI